MATDQCHEQNKAMMKRLGWAVGGTKDPAAVKHWTVAGPEVARLIIEFEKDDMCLSNQEPKKTMRAFTMNSNLECSLSSSKM